MQLSNLTPNKKVRQPRKRVGRGIAGGQGKTCGRGSKGQKSRQGTRKFTAGFEGGQLPLFRRMPRLRGFKSVNRVEYQPVNLSALEKSFQDNDQVDKMTLAAKNLIAKVSQSVKILGMGDLTKKLNIEVDAVSASAKKKIEKAGGRIGGAKAEK